MIKPERMCRIALAGPRKKLGDTIRVLYELDSFHLVDFVEEDPEVKIGVPLAGASEISQRLIKLRSIIRSLHLEEAKPKEPVSVKTIESTSDQAIATLEIEVNRKVERRQSLTSKIKELQNQNFMLSSFDSIGLPLRSYSAYGSLTVIAGTASISISAPIRETGATAEIIERQKDGAFIFSIFCRNEDLDKVQRILGAASYQEIKAPYLDGTAREHIESNEKRIAELEASLVKEEEAIASLKEQYTDLILAAEEHYSIESIKSDTPLRVATTTNSFVIDGWLPQTQLETVKSAMREKIGSDVTVESLTISKNEEQELAPVKLRNPRLARPFELFIELMSTPLYREVDPTIFVFTVFPIFFGLMIGDFGYGMCLILAGLVMYKKLGKDSEGWRQLGAIVMAGGLFASAFGLLLFCDMFGLPFHPVINEEGEAVLGGISWESAGLHIPLEAVMEKLIDVKDLLAISVFAAWLHMSIGLALGFVNERKHDRKHAASKIVWLIILMGLFIQILFMAKGSELRNGMFLLFCSSFESLTFSVVGLNISMVGVGMIAVGVASLFALFGKAAMMEVMEILSLLSNVISYTRIAAIGVAKGAMALAFNFIVINYIFASGGTSDVIGILLLVVGAFVLVLLQLLVFALGSLSAGIQALRLNYVEFFLKFYHGGGVSFKPLGYKRKFSKVLEV